MKLKALVPLVLVIAAVFAAGCLNTGGVTPDTDDDNRTGIEEIGDEDDNTPTQNATRQTSTTGNTDTQTTNTGNTSTTGTSGTSGSTGTEEQCDQYGVCGTVRPMSDFYNETT